jgi:peroxiredoxin
METSKSDFLSKLAELRAMHCDQMPTPQLAVMTRLTARLRKSGILGRCLQAGETAPDFTFINGQNERASLYGCLDTGPVVINFFRGLWCPYCKTEFEAFSSIRSQLDELGCTCLAVTPQRLEQDSHDRYALIFDRDNEIARKFDLLYTLKEEEIALFDELDVPLEGASSELPLPATYLIDVDRVVAFQFVDVDFRMRCCPDDLVSEVERLAR